MTNEAIQNAGLRILLMCLFLLYLGSGECYGASAEDLIRSCVEREESLRSGRIEFEYTIRNEEGAIIETGDVYCEWAPGNCLRIGYLGDTRNPIVVCDGAFCLTECGIRWARDFLTTAFLPELPLEGVSNESMENLQRARLMYYALVRHFLFPITEGREYTYEYLAFDNAFAVVDESERTELSLVQITPRPVAGMVVKYHKLYALDKRGLPSAYWVAIDDHEPALCVAWEGAKELSNCGLVPERMNVTYRLSLESVCISVVLRGDGSKCGPIEADRFTWSKDRVSETVDWPSEDTRWGILISGLNWIDKEIFSRVPPEYLGLAVVATGIGWLVFRFRARNHPRGRR